MEEECGMNKVATSQLTQLTAAPWVWAILDMTGWSSMVESSNQWQTSVQNIVHKTTNL